MLDTLSCQRCRMSMSNYSFCRNPLSYWLDLNRRPSGNCPRMEFKSSKALTTGLFITDKSMRESRCQSVSKYIFYEQHLSYKMFQSANWYRAPRVDIHLHLLLCIRARKKYCKIPVEISVTAKLSCRQRPSAGANS